MKTMIILLCTIMICGCTMMRETAIDISEEELLNAEMAREVASNYLSMWSIQSGFIRGALGSRIDDMPAQAVIAMDELDQLANEDPNSYTDYDLGLSLGLRARLLGSVVQEALRMYAPDILDLLPILL